MLNGIRAVAKCDVCGKRKPGLSVLLMVDDENDAGTAAHTCDECEATIPVGIQCSDGADLDCEPF